MPSTTDLTNSQDKTSNGSDSYSGPPMENGFDDTDLSLDRILDIIGTQRRRLVLDYLMQTKGSVLIPDVVDYVHGREDSDASWKSVYVSLHQFHLQQLQKEKVIVYDEDERTIFLGENGEGVLKILARIRDVDDPEKKDGTFWNDA